MLVILYTNCIYIYIYIYRTYVCSYILIYKMLYIEDACGEYRRPLSFQLDLFGEPPLEVHGERPKLEAKIQQKFAQKA